MINDYHIKSINHSDNSKLFKNADIKGGISYFLLDKEYNDFPYLSFLSSKFDLKSNPEILTIRDLNGLKIYEKASKLKSIDYRFCPKSFWGVKTNSKDFLNFEEKNSILCYVSKAKGFKKYILKNRVQNIDKINKWKVILRAADGKGYDSTSYCFIAKPGEICSESYVLFIFDTEIEAINFVKYFNTKIFKYLMSIKKIKQDVTKEVFSIIPDIDFLSDFNLKELYEKLELDCNDISFIENYNCL
jgi:site-specific DNA-methyltransferase (adenine-specific)